MRKNVSIIFLMTFHLIFLSCNIYKEEKTICDVSKFSGLIGSNIYDIQMILEKEYYVKEIEVEDEGEIWRALLCSKGSLFNKNSLLVETSWLDKNVISRISLLDNTLSIHNDSVSVDMEISKIANFISKEIPNSPDGYFFLKDKYCPNINYELEITEKDSLLYFGMVYKIKEIPTNRRVKRIIIN